jgi:hypothetical protein
MAATPTGAPHRRGILLGAQAFGLAALFGCRKGDRDKSDHALTVEAVQKSLDELRTRLDELKKKFMALRAEVDSVPPDLPGFSDVRVKFYATEEGRGTTDAKSVWLASQLEAAAKAGNRAELEQVSKDIAATYDDIRKIDDLHVKLLHQVMAFQRTARQAQQAEKEAEKAAPEATPPAAAGKSPRPKAGAKPPKPTP